MPLAGFSYLHTPGVSNTSFTSARAHMEIRNVYNESRLPTLEMSQKESQNKSNEEAFQPCYTVRITKLEPVSNKERQKKFEIILKSFCNISCPYVFSGAELRGYSGRGYV